MATCKLTGKIINIKGEGIQGAKITITPSFTNQILESSTMMVYPYNYYLTTDSNGDFEVDLVQGLYFNVNAPEVNYTKQVRIPFTSTGYLFLL